MDRQSARYLLQSAAGLLKQADEPFSYWNMLYGGNRPGTLFGPSSSGSKNTKPFPRGDFGNNRKQELDNLMYGEPFTDSELSRRRMRMEPELLGQPGASTSMYPFFDNIPPLRKNDPSRRYSSQTEPTIDSYQARPRGPFSAGKGGGPTVTADNPLAASKPQPLPEHKPASQSTAETKLPEPELPEPAAEVPGSDIADVVQPEADSSSGSQWKELLRSIGGSYAQPSLTEVAANAALKRPHRQTDSPISDMLTAPARSMSGAVDNTVKSQKAVTNATGQAQNIINMLRVGLPAAYVGGGVGLGAGIGGLAGSIAGHGRGHTAAGLGRGLVRGGATGGGVAAGSLLGQAAGGALGHAGLGSLLGGGLGGAAGWLGSGALLGKPKDEREQLHKAACSLFTR